MIKLDRPMQSVVIVTALDLETLIYVTLDRDACRFAYRSSIFNATHRNRYIVTAVEFQFDLTAKPNLTYADLTRHFAARFGLTPGRWAALAQHAA